MVTRRIWTTQTSGRTSVWNGALSTPSQTTCDLMFRDRRRASARLLTTRPLLLWRFIAWRQVRTKRLLLVSRRLLVRTSASRLATGNSYHSIAALFGTHKSVVCKSTQLVVNALVKRSPQWIKMPCSDNDVTAAALASEQLFKGQGIPSIVTMVDGSHIKIEYSDRRAGYMDWRCRKGYPAMNLMGMCDASSKFVAVNAGWAGSVGDARVFRNTTMGKRVLDNTIFKGMSISLLSANHAQVPFAWRRGRLRLRPSLPVAGRRQA